MVLPTKKSGINKKTCQVCKQEKSLTDFYSSRGYLDNMCKKCKLKRYKEKYWENPEEKREKRKVYVKNNPNLFSKYGRRTRNKEKFGGNMEKALIRDNYTCQKCNSKDRIVVHHKDLSSCYSKDRDHSLDSLISLCHSCHAIMHSQIRRRDKYGKYTSSNKKVGN